MGKLKKRISPSDITINIGKDAPIPECPIPGERFRLFYYLFVFPHCIRSHFSDVFFRVMLLLCRLTAGKKLGMIILLLG